MNENISKEEIEFELTSKNEGIQVLLPFKDDKINIIVRNQQRMKDEKHKYKVILIKI